MLTRAWNDWQACIDSVCVTSKVRLVMWLEQSPCHLLLLWMPWSFVFTAMNSANWSILLVYREENVMLCSIHWLNFLQLWNIKFTCLTVSKLTWPLSTVTPGFRAGFPTVAVAVPYSHHSCTSLSCHWGERAQGKYPSGCRTCGDWCNVILVLLFGVSVFFLTLGSQGLGQHGFLIWKSWFLQC